MGSEGLHEPLGLLDDAAVDHHRALTSLCEELDAIDWYDQRVRATDDTSLAAVLAYNRDDEKEHAAMVLEWLRRRDPALDANLRTYLFTSEPITELGAGAGATGATDPGSPGTASLGIGSLKAAAR
ncbi:MAG: encapsulin-associated ferritin-like protein [Acidimicrobiales bacterium]